MKQGYIVVAVCLRLQKGAREDIAAKMEDFKRRRTTKQPLEYPSAEARLSVGRVFCWQVDSGHRA